MSIDFDNLDRSTKKRISDLQKIPKSKLIRLKNSTESSLRNTETELSFLKRDLEIYSFVLDSLS